jgi:protoporphyrinogen oxidase
VSELAAQLRYRAIMLVNLCVNKPEVIKPFWIYYTDRLFNRISEYRHFSSNLAPQGKTGICMEIGCDIGDELWNAPDEEIVHLCVNDLENLGLLTRHDIEGELIIREPNAYPIYDVGYKQRVKRLVEWLRDEAGIFTAGRQGRFLYINQDAAIISGLEAGEEVHELIATDSTGGPRLEPDPAKRREITG